MDKAQLPLPGILLVNNFTSALFLLHKCFFKCMKLRDRQFCLNPNKVIYLKVLLSRKSTKWSQVVFSPLPPLILVICISKWVMFMLLSFWLCYVRKKSGFYQALTDFFEKYNRKKCLG